MEVITLVKTALSNPAALANISGDTVIGALSVSSSFLTNLWATSLVIFRTLCVSLLMLVEVFADEHFRKFRQDFVKVLRDLRPGKSERVLMLLVESGVLYCLFWVAVVSMAWSGIGVHTPDLTSPKIVAQSSIFASMAQLCVSPSTSGPSHSH